MNYTYIVKCADSTLYTGWTNDLDKRIKAHNSGKGAKYTKTRRPVKLVYYEEHETKNEAMSREYAIKHLTRKEKEILIKGNGNLCGSWMVKGDMIKAGEFEKIKKLTREAKELAELLLKHPDFDVNFSFSEIDSSEWGMTVRKFDIEEKAIDLGYSDKIFSLGGKEV